MERSHYQELFDEHKKFVYDKEIAKLKEYLNNGDGRVKAHKLREFRFERVKETDDLLKYYYPNKSHKDDGYIEALIVAFNKRSELYEKDEIDYFLKNEFIKLKGEFTGKPEAVLKPEVFALNEFDTLKFLAKVEALRKFTYDTDIYTPLKDDSTDLTIENIITGNWREVHERDFLFGAPLNPIDSGIKWKGKNKTEFVQLIYALYEDGLIDNEKSEVTKLVADLAIILGLDLGKNWQSNHTKSITNRNNDYDIKIFDRIKRAYENYREDALKTKGNANK